MLSGDNGILQRATTAKENTDNAQIKERIQLAYLSAISGGQENLTEETFKNELIKEFGASKIKDDTISTSEDGKTWTVTIDGASAEVAAVDTTPTEPQPGESGYAGGSYNDPYIPVGFTHTGSENWNYGYTITGNADSENPGDKFVWVPCSTEATPPDGVVKFEKITTGKYNSNNLWLHPTGGINSNVDSEDSTVAEIRTSVETYGGFYIAKYEAGIEGEINNKNLDTKTLADGSIKPLSQEGKGVWDAITRTEALIISKAMIPSTTGTKSTLISGECWDTTLAWITATADSEYAENSEGKGWYRQSSDSQIHTTGYYGTNTNNIFDMGGNAYEYTSENCFHGIQDAVARGGDCTHNGTDNPASLRDYWSAESHVYGFRVVLYK